MNEWVWVVGEMLLTGESEVLGRGGESCPSATLSNTDPTWTDLGSNLGLHGDRPATNGLNLGTVHDCL